MKAETGEWIAKAEGDFNDVLRGIRARKNPNYDSVCYHAEQCIEKYLKARLVEAGLSFPKTHDLSALLDMAAPLEPLWESFREDLNLLTSFAVEYRYPGETATKEDANRAYSDCRKIRAQILESAAMSSGPA